MLMFLFVGSYRHLDRKRKKKNVRLKPKPGKRLSREIEPWGAKYAMLESIECISHATFEAKINAETDVSDTP
jgi:hypothetical protein